MEFARVGLVFVIFLSVGLSAPVTDCDSLIQPLQIKRDDLLGKWFYIAESTNILSSHLLTKMFVDSVWGNVTATSQENGINAYFAYKMLGGCFSLSTSYSLVNNTVSMARPYESTAVLLNTGCPDCLIFSTKVTFGSSTYSGVQLLSKRSEVTAAQLEEFKKQVECLKLPSPAILDSKKGFCPDGSQSQETKITDLTDTMNNMGSEALDTFNSYFNSESGVNSFIQLVNSALKQT